MDIFEQRLEDFLDKKTKIVKQHIQKDTDEKMKTREALGEQGLTYDMNKFLKSVREFEAERAKKNKKHIKDYHDM